MNIERWAGWTGWEPFTVTHGAKSVMPVKSRYNGNHLVVWPFTATITSDDDGDSNYSDYFVVWELRAQDGSGPGWGERIRLYGSGYGTPLRSQELTAKKVQCAVTLAAKHAEEMRVAIERVWLTGAHPWDGETEALARTRPFGVTDEEIQQALTGYHDLLARQKVETSNVEKMPVYPSEAVTA